VGRSLCLGARKERLRAPLPWRAMLMARFTSSALLVGARSFRGSACFKRASTPANRGRPSRRSPQSTVSNGAFDLAFDSSRNLYLVGYAAVGPSSNLVNKWIVHRRVFTTQAWQTWFPFGDAQSIDDRSEARAVTTDALGTYSSPAPSAIKECGTAWCRNSRREIRNPN